MTRSALLLLTFLAACDRNPASDGVAPHPAPDAAVTPSVQVVATKATVPVTPAAGSAAVKPGAGSSSSVVTFKLKDRVSALYSDGYWYDATISKLNANGTYVITYYDGFVTMAQPAAKLRLRKAAASTASGARECVSWTGGECTTWKRKGQDNSCTSWVGGECVARRGDPVCTSWEGGECVAW